MKVFFAFFFLEPYPPSDTVTETALYTHKSPQTQRCFPLHLNISRTNHRANNAYTFSNLKIVLGIY